MIKKFIEKEFKDINEYLSELKTIAKHLLIEAQENTYIYGWIKREKIFSFGELNLLKRIVEENCSWNENRIERNSITLVVHSDENLNRQEQVKENIQIW